MKIIQKNPNPSGAYPGIQEGTTTIYDGFALWPDDLNTDIFYAHNGFVVLAIENVDGVDMVASYSPNVEAWEMWKDGLPDTTNNYEESQSDNEREVWDAMAQAYNKGFMEGVQQA